MINLKEFANSLSKKTKEELQMDIKKATEKSKQTNLNWLDNEIADQQTKQLPTGEKLPKLKLEPNKITDIEIDPEKQFGSWVDPSSGTPFAIIEAKNNKEMFVWFLNKKNPIYRDILTGLKNGKTTFKVLRTGMLKDTKYVLVE